MESGDDAEKLVGAGGKAPRSLSLVPPGPAKAPARLLPSSQLHRDRMGWLLAGPEARELGLRLLGSSASGGLWL